jgi:two-component system NtrC family sensor kinase
MAAERPEDHEENGMMLRAAVPVRDESGRQIGVLYGGLLLSRNFDLVDRVKEIVFKGEKYHNEDIGTATIFQWDLRVSTNVLDDQGERALGTRVSREVNQAVLQEGGHWVGRAFVVRAWYITAYEPIRDIDGQIVGILYVGMLERPYIDIRNRIMGTFALLAGLCTVFLLLLLSFVATNVTKPLRVMVEATDRIAQGDLSHRVRIDLKDEVGHLAESFNRMTEELVVANENLTQWGRILEKRVEERTRELREAQDALVQSEKLASLGKIAAGVAHEINNPLTSILINAALMLERTDIDEACRENLTMISEETTRCAQIVRGLLEFSRQTPSQVVKTDVNELIDKTVQVFEKQAAFRNVTVVRKLDRSLPPVELDKNKMQQVFSNLAINAFEAMHEEGTLTITTRRDEAGKMIEVRFADTGVGIPRENLIKLFDPFFTTKSFGTGLGLSVSYGIIEQAGGTIKVESEVGRGSTFVITLPLGDGGGGGNDGRGGDGDEADSMRPKGTGRDER